MDQIFAHQGHEDLLARARLRRRYLIAEVVTVVLALNPAAAGRRDGRTADSEAPSIGMAPIAVDRVGPCGADCEQQRQWKQDRRAADAHGRPPSDKLPDCAAANDA